MKGAVLIIGAAGGVGLETARQVKAAGYPVIATVLNDAEKQKLETEVTGLERIVILDLSNADTVRDILVPVLDERDGELVAAVVCAAFSPQGPLETAPLDDLRRVLEVNTISNVAVFQTCMPYLRRSQGRLILTSSVGGRSAMPFIGHYVASKFALEGLVDIMRRETARSGVRIILMEPGALKTPMTFSQPEKIEQAMAGLGPEEKALYGDLYKSFRGIALGAMAKGTEPDVVANAIVEALQAEQPRTRYPVGQDAEQMIGMTRSATDEEIDETYAGIYAQAAAAVDQ